MLKAQEKKMTQIKEGDIVLLNRSRMEVIKVDVRRMRHSEDVFTLILRVGCAFQIELSAVASFGLLVEEET